MRLALLLVSLCLLTNAQDPFAGDFSGDGIQLKIASTGRDYTGTILFEGRTLPLKARKTGNHLTGEFRFEEQSFPILIKREGATLVLTTDDATYRLSASVVQSAPANPLGRPPAPAPTGLVGTWRGPNGTVRFDANGTGSSPDGAFRYQLQGDTLTLMSAEGMLRGKVRIEGTQLRFSGNDGSVIELVRAGEAPPAAAGGMQAELAGKWCYVANVNATGGGARASQQCFTLHPDGRYEFYGETDSYGPAGGATSQSSDRGTWSATASTITARSGSGRVTTYQLEKRNHPKTGDPMLVLDGQAFVTFFQKAPWR